MQPFSAHAFARQAIIVEHNAGNYYYTFRLISECGGTQNWMVTISLEIDTLLRRGFLVADELDPTLRPALLGFNSLATLTLVSLIFAFANFPPEIPWRVALVNCLAPATS